MSMFSSDIPPPKELLPDPKANEAFEAYFRNLNQASFDNWQVFKGDAHAKPTTVQTPPLTLPDNDKNRWLYVKGTGNAFSAMNGPGWIVGSKAMLKNYKAKPEGTEEVNECKATLTPADLGCVTGGPKTLAPMPRGIKNTGEAFWAESAP